jgi:Ca2+-transporting ATPase
MITGDARPTALAIARELGLQEGGALSASDIDGLSDDQLIEVVPQTNVFFRMTPAHKVKIVNAYKAGGRVVAMTGDGVNDAPALSRSDIGIAMGKGGSDVCTQAADVVLVDNNFSTIVEAIKEGKVIFNNIKNFLHFQLTTSIAAMLLTACCSLADLPLPLNPTQILLINIIMDGPPAQSLTFESNGAAEKAPPRDRKAPIVDRRTIAKIVISALIMVAGTMWIFLKDIPGGSQGLAGLHEMNETPKHASTMAFTTFVLFQMFNALNCRSLSKSVFTVGLFSNHYLLLSMLGSLLAQLAVIYIPFLSIIFHTVPLSLVQIGWCFAVASTVWLVDECWKLLLGFK